MMLWYKAWLESRTRFVISAAALASFCLFVVLFQSQIRSQHELPPGLRSVAYSQYIYNFIYGTAKGLFAMFILPFLGAGGLLRERAYGTAAFTLALPVSRPRLVTARAGVGLLELAVLSLLPAFLVPGLSPLVHQSYPLSQTLHFSALWFGYGTVVFAIAFLLSAALPGEFTAPAACIIVIFVEDPIALRFAPSWKLLWIMSDVRWDAQHNLLHSGPTPWMSLVVATLIALGMLVTASLLTRRQDF